MSSFNTMYPSRKRDHYSSVSQLHNDIDSLFGDFFGNRAWPFFVKEADLMPSLDVVSDEKSYCMNLELPGVAVEDVKIQVLDKVLTISGEKKEESKENTKTHVQERSYGSFSRSLTLPEDADVENISASSKDGILTISIPKKAPAESKSRQITIQKA